MTLPISREFQILLEEWLIKSDGRKRVHQYNGDVSGRSAQRL